MLTFVKPTSAYQEKALEYIQEFYQYHSNINGVGGLNRYLEDYDGWLTKLERDRNQPVTEERVPGETYFLVREEDDRIVGMINIRLALNEKLKEYGGHIGYSIRPTERGKGYNKVNLYLGLKVCQQHGIEEVFMDCDKDNPASARTMLALGGKLIREYYSKRDDGIVQDYVIDVNQSLEKYAAIYEPMVTYPPTTDQKEVR